MLPAVAPPWDARCFLFGTNPAARTETRLMGETLKEIEADDVECCGCRSSGRPAGPYLQARIWAEIRGSDVLASVPTVLHS